MSGEVHREVAVFADPVAQPFLAFLADERVGREQLDERGHWSARMSGRAFEAMIKDVVFRTMRRQYHQPAEADFPGKISRASRSA